MSMRRMLARAGVLVGALAITLSSGLLGSGVSTAEPPLRADGQITDLVGALVGGQDRVAQALDRLQEDDETQLFVVFVSSFDGLDGPTWADQSAQQSQLGSRDVLFAVAVDDRSYGLSVDQDYPLSDQELDDLTANDVEPLLSDEDWPGAAIAMADGLRSAG
ncbi:MAG: TPM domain-containing protein, partial [Actinomycetota bacterium]|nr:TPM domain-containing protein [Actinomycetota bacterium]